MWAESARVAHTLAQAIMTRPDFDLAPEGEAVQAVLSDVRKADQGELAQRRSLVLTFAKMFMSLASQAQQDPKDRALMSGTSLGT